MFNFLRRTMLWVVMLPYAVGFVGAASNQLVFVANHGKFPVEVNPVWAEQINPALPGGMIDDRHCVMSSETHLNLLADVFNFHATTLSIGDLLLQFGEWLNGFCLFVWLALTCRRLI